MSGGAGVDGVRIEDIEAMAENGFSPSYEVSWWSDDTGPRRCFRVMIPKPHGGKRPLGIPTIKDRVVQAAAKLVLEPLFKADFLARRSLRISSSSQRPRMRFAVHRALSRARSGGGCRSVEVLRYHPARRH